MSETARSAASRGSGGTINVENKSLLNLLDDKNEKDMDENAPGKDSRNCLCTVSLESNLHKNCHTKNYMNN